ncbi:MAG: ASCH domain-containing protein [Caulobacteraceae bacterium]|nr:ASCH domain-containing protein [Caulobacteraceae bacterium]
MIQTQQPSTLIDLFGCAEIKAISLWQPWASLVAAHVKRHETRHWPTTYRGPIAIHAAKRLDVAGAPEDLCIAALGRDWRHTVPLGAVVAVGVLTRCRDARAVLCGVTEADRAAGNFAPGRFAWAIERVRALDRPPRSPGPVQLGPAGGYRGTPRPPRRPRRRMPPDRVGVMGMVNQLYLPAMPPLLDDIEDDEQGAQGRACPRCCGQGVEPDGWDCEYCGGDGRVGL